MANGFLPDTTPPGAAPMPKGTSAPTSIGGGHTPLAHPPAKKGGKSKGLSKGGSKAFKGRRR